MSFGLFTQFGTAPNMAGNLGQLGAYALGSLSRSPDFGIQHPPRYFGPPMNLNNLTPPAVSQSLNQNAQKITNNHRDLVDRLDDMLDKAEIPYDGASSYMEDLEKHIAEMTKQQEAEEKEILEKKLKELNDENLNKKYKNYEDEQKKIQEERVKLKNIQDPKTKKETEAKLSKREEANRKNLDEVYRGYDKAIGSKIQKIKENNPERKELTKDRDAVRYLYERRKQIEELDKDFKAIKEEYFTDPKTGDWSKTKIKDGYSKALRDSIQPRMKDLEYGFDRNRVWHQAEDGLGVLSEKGSTILKDLLTRFENNNEFLNYNSISID